MKLYFRQPAETEANVELAKSFRKLIFIACCNQTWQVIFDLVNPKNLSVVLIQTVSKHSLLRNLLIRVDTWILAHDVRVINLYGIDLLHLLLLALEFFEQGDNAVRVVFILKDFSYEGSHGLLLRIRLVLVFVCHLNVLKLIPLSDECLL